MSAGLEMLIRIPWNPDSFNRPTIVFIILMMLVFIVLGFFISSSSGLAVLSIPIMAPLADTVGVSRSAIVSAYAYGLGLISFITNRSDPCIPCDGGCYL